MLARLCAVLVVGALVSTAASADDLNCNVGPVTKSIAGTKWLVYSCHDDHHILFVTAPGSPAMPFLFMAWTDDGVLHVTGEGDGPKQFTDPAAQELRGLSETSIAALIAETKLGQPSN